MSFSQFFSLITNGGFQEFLQEVVGEQHISGVSLSVFQGIAAFFFLFFWRRDEKFMSLFPDLRNGFPGNSHKGLRGTPNKVSEKGGGGIAKKKQERYRISTMSYFRCICGQFFRVASGKLPSNYGYRSLRRSWTLTGGSWIQEGFRI